MIEQLLCAAVLQQLPVQIAIALVFVPVTIAVQQLASYRGGATVCRARWFVVEAKIFVGFENAANIGAEPKQLRFVLVASKIRRWESSPRRRVASCRHDRRANAILVHCVIRSGACEYSLSCRLVAYCFVAWCLVSFRLSSCSPLWCTARRSGLALSSTPSAARCSALALLQNTLHCVGLVVNCSSGFW